MEFAKCSDRYSSGRPVYLANFDGSRVEEFVTSTVFAGISGASHAGILIQGSNYLEALSDAKYLVFDKTGTLTQGVFEVTGVHHSTLEEAELLEYAALAECASSHPISKSLQKAYGKEIDRSRVSDIEEISGHGITAVAPRSCPASPPRWTATPSPRATPS